MAVLKEGSTLGSHNIVKESAIDSSVFVGGSISLSNFDSHVSMGTVLLRTSNGAIMFGTIDSLAPPPTYYVSMSATSVDEGSSLTATVTTTNIADGTTLYYTLTNSSDFTASSGSFTITSNSGSFTISPIADNTTEGSETFTASVRTVSTSGTIVTTSNSITINDTSLTPNVIGEHQFTTTGTHTFTVPANVTQVSAVCVGGGGGSSYCQGNSSESGAGGGGGGLSNAAF